MMADRPFSDISYGQYLNEEKLMGSKCKKCGAVYAPPRPLCRKCHSKEMEWVQMKGRGKLAAFTSIAVGPPYMIKEGYDRKHPYISGVVELEEGAKVDARIEGLDGTKPETIKVGTPMAVQYLHRGEGENMKTYLAFKPS
ncbi:MAG: Zn-ribbon domain-containing OB-fold protein [Chloroflexi bacterium]|nr:Zn-ribbon domain-containing OB-fold protein [Chloroflexota bacterium]